MPPKKNAIGRRERRDLGILSPVAAAAAAPAAAEPNRSESMVLVTPEEQQQQQQEPYSLSPIAAADESMNQTDSDYEPQGSPRFNMMDSSDSSMGSSPTPIMRKMLGMKKKSPRKSPKRRNSPPRRKSSPRRNSPRAQTFRRKSKLSIDNPEYLKASPSVAQIRDKLMSLAQVASKTRENSGKINKFTEKIRRMLDELNPYFLFIQQYIAGRGEIQRELNAVVEDRTKLMGERERLVGDLADKSQMNANSKIQEVAEGQIGILNDQISELNKRIEELGAQLESATRANQMYENILRDIPADIDKMRGFIDAEDATLSENITALDQVLSNFSNQLKERLQNTLPQDQHAAFNASRGGGCRKSRKYRQSRQSRKYRKMTRKSRKSRKHRKMTRKSRK
jgi:predicted  nucleic acid-binding Zn-ribbon protein